MLSSHSIGLCQPRTRGDTGFTLIEVMVALVVFLVASVGLAQLLAMTTRMHLQANNTTEATRLAESKIDELMTLDLGTDPSIRVAAVDVLNTNVIDYFDTPVDGATRRWSVTRGPTPTTRTVTVRVILKAGSLGERTVDLTTVLRQFSQYGEARRRGGKGKGSE